jgi:broad specificity phosphatase PhoE
MSKLILVRHPETDFNSAAPGAHRLRSWKDVPLNAAGKKDAVLVARNVVAKEHPKRLYSSTLQRAMDLADEISDEASLPVIKAPQAKTWNLGTLAGKEIRDVKDTLAEFSTKKRGEMPPEGGETFDNFLERWLGFLQQIAGKSPGPIAVVTHIQNILTAEDWDEAGQPDDFSSLDYRWDGQKDEDMSPGKWLTIEVQPTKERPSIVPKAQAAKAKSQREALEA